MIYYTIKLPKMYHQMTFEDFLQNKKGRSVINGKETATRTYEVCGNSYDKLKEKFVNIDYLIELLRRYNETYKRIRTEVPRNELYRSFKIPKKSGGLRQIDAPNSELMGALKHLKAIFEEDFGVLYHTNAYAYIKNRSTIDAVKRHQYNESKWFGKYDLSNFFGSTTPEFLISMMSMIFPFSEIVKNPEGKMELKNAIDLAFLNGGLPQGTPISPLLTNLMMIPVDYILTKELRDHNKQSFVYTRYADDFLISSQYNFNFREIEKLIVDTLAGFGAPFSLNSKKTRYGSSAGSNWNLGVMLNKDNQITVGYKKKKEFQAMLSAYIKDKQNGIAWDLGDVQTMEGYRNYYHMVEGETIDKIVQHINEKFSVNVLDMIKEDLRCGIRGGY